MSSFISRNLTEIEAITGCTFACICNTVFRMFSCLQINCQPFYLPQLLKFHQFDWLIEIYLQTKGQGTHHKMVSLQPMSGFSPLFAPCLFSSVFFDLCSTSTLLPQPLKSSNRPGNRCPWVIIITLILFGNQKRRIDYVDVRYMSQKSFVFTKNCFAIVLSEQ